MILPTYMLRRLSLKPGGDRMPKLVPLPKYTYSPMGFVTGSNVTPITRGLKSNFPDKRPCAECGEQVELYSMHGIAQLKGQWRGGDMYYHDDCLQLISHGSDKGVKGSLPNEEYRFWIGYPHDTGQGAQCRRCGYMAWGQTQRKAHLDDVSCAVDGLRCTELLTRTYDGLLLDKVACIVCHKDRGGYSKWGVPICNSRSCEYTWRFDKQKEYIMITTRLKKFYEAGLVRAKLTGNDDQMKKIQALFVKDKKVTEITWCNQCRTFTSGTEHEKDHKPREWCSTCGIYKDNPTHAEVHAEAELKAGFDHNMEHDY